jgi:hypothetical protein
VAIPATMEADSNEINAIAIVLSKVIVTVERIE